MPHGVMSAKRLYRKSRRV